MAEPEFTPEDLEALLASANPTAFESDIGALIGESTASQQTGTLPPTALPNYDEEPPPTLPLDSELVALFGETSIVARRAESPGSPTTSPMVLPPAAPREAALQQEEHFAWLDALHLVPGYEGVLCAYPPITERQHPEFGRVIVLAYLEDKGRRVRRNFMVRGRAFFDAPELLEIAPDSRDLNCRVVIKVIAYEVGMLIRCWENRPGGDVPGQSVLIKVTEKGLMRRRAK